MSAIRAITYNKRKQKKASQVTFFNPDPSDVSAVIERLQAFGKKTQGSNYYSTDEEGINISTKRSRIETPAARNPNIRERALTVVRRRPLVPYTRYSPIQSIETASASIYRRIVTRTRIRNIDTLYVPNNLSDITHTEFTKTNKHIVTVTRRRKIKPTAATSVTTHTRKRITRKKLINVRPVPKPTLNLAIITTGFYAAPSLEEENGEYIYSDDVIMPTPDLYLSSISETIKTSSPDLKQSLSNLGIQTSSNDLIIITDNFFFPAINEETADNRAISDEMTDIKPDKFINVTSSTALRIENMKSDSVSEGISIEKKTKKTGFDHLTTSSLGLADDDESTTIEKSEKIVTESIAVISDANKSKPLNGSNMNTSNSNITTVNSSLIHRITEKTRDYNDLRVIPIIMDLGMDISVVAEQTLISHMDNIFGSNHGSSEIPTVVPLETLPFDKEINERRMKASLASDSQVTTPFSSLTPEDIEASLTDDLYLSLSRPDFTQIMQLETNPKENIFSTAGLSQTVPELESSVYYSVTVVTSARLRTYTYVVTKLKGQETEVTSSTVVRPRVTTLTLTVPVTVTVTPTIVSSSIAFSSPLGEYLSIQKLISPTGFNYISISHIWLLVSFM